MADFYFGNLVTGLAKRPAPETGMDADFLGSSEVLEFANGGANVVTSPGTHREFGMSWPVNNKGNMNWLVDYRNGVYGDGLLYMVDPFATNIMPAHWARPELTCRGWPSLMGAATQPTRTPSVVRVNETLNPAFTVNTTGWTGNASAPLTHDAATGRGKMTVTAATAANALLMYETAVTPYTMGVRESARMTVTNARASAATFQLGIIPYNSSGTSLAGTVLGTAVSIPANGTVDLTVNGANLVTAGTVSYRLALYAVSTLAVGNIVYVDNALTETADTVGPYFDGTTAFVDGTAGAWSGTANASFSTLPQAIGPMPNDAATYTFSVTPGTVPARKLTLMIPLDQDLYLGFSGSATNGGVVRMRPITLDGAYGPVSDLTLLPPVGNTRMNTKIAGSQYRAVQLYITSNSVGSATVTLASGKAVYSTPSVTPVLTGVHTEGEGHTGLSFVGSPKMQYIQGVNGRKLVSAAATFKEVEAWL